MDRLILASASGTRAGLLRAAGVEFDLRPARIDEPALRESLVAEGASPRDIADVLAEAKARQVARSHPDASVLGCDQILEFEGEILGKPHDIQALRDRLWQLRGKTHRLHTAAVLYAQAEPVWRHVCEARLTMRSFTEDFLETYLSEADADILNTVGGYAVESLGLRLFERIEGDYFGILGLPMMQVLSVLTRRGVIPA